MCPLLAKETVLGPVSLKNGATVEGPVSNFFSLLCFGAQSIRRSFFRNGRSQMLALRRISASGHSRPSQWLVLCARDVRLAPRATARQAGNAAARTMTADDRGRRILAPGGRQSTAWIYLRRSAGLIDASFAPGISCFRTKRTSDGWQSLQLRSRMAQACRHRQCLARRHLPDHSYRVEAEFPKGCRLKPHTFLCAALVWSKQLPIARVTLDLTRNTNAFHVGPETS
jgi:hypothetical protein